MLLPINEYKRNIKNKAGIFDYINQEIKPCGVKLVEIRKIK